MSETRMNNALMCYRATIVAMMTLIDDHFPADNEDVRKAKDCLYQSLGRLRFVQMETEDGLRPVRSEESGVRSDDLAGDHPSRLTPNALPPAGRASPLTPHPLRLTQER